MNYVQTARKTLSEELPGLPPELIDLYALLVFTQGENVTRKDVHDAWSVWKNQSDPDHRSLIPFEDLSEEVRELDRKYAEGIARTAKTLPVKS